MTIAPNAWLDLIRREYLTRFIREGGAAVKFVVSGDTGETPGWQESLCAAAEEEGFLFANVDADVTKLHLIEQLFFAVARAVPWDTLTRTYVSRLITEHGYSVPAAADAFTWRELAALNEREETLLRRDLAVWLEAAIYRDHAMSQDFRRAMIQLCLCQLEGGESPSFLHQSVKEWLCGDLRLISALKDALIVRKIARHNARHLFYSLTHWLKVVGLEGLVLTMDIGRYLIAGPASSQNGNGPLYSPAAVLDAYELLRQFIDGCDELTHCLIVVAAPGAFLSDDLRGLNRYDALKLRIWDEVRDKSRDNPFAPLIRLGPEGAGPLPIAYRW